MFGSNLRNARKAKGYTLQELSDLYNEVYGAGMNKGTLSRYENNKQEPMISVVANLATLLDTPIDSLIERENKPFEKRPIFSDFNDFECKLILEYRKLDDIDKTIIHRILHLDNAKQSKSSPASLRLIAKPYLEPVAARERTDIEVTDEMRKHDDNIMDDPNF